MQVHLKIYVRNETSHWPPDVQRRAGHGIYRAYLYDSLRVGHCHETTPSYQLWPLYTSAYRKVIEVLGLPSQIRLWEEDKPIYIYRWRLDRMPAMHFHDCGVQEIPEGVTYGAYFLEQINHYTANPVITIPSGTSIPRLTYECDYRRIYDESLTDECWQVRFKRAGMNGPTRTRPRNPYQGDQGLAELERWVLEECHRHHYDAAEIRFALP